MENFDDFRKSVNLPLISARAGAVAAQSLGFGLGMELPADLLPEVAGRAAAEATMECLSRYHSWLSCQLE